MTVTYEATTKEVGALPRWFPSLVYLPMICFFLSESSAEEIGGSAWDGVEPVNRVGGTFGLKQSLNQDDTVELFPNLTGVF